MSLFLFDTDHMFICSDHDESVNHSQQAKQKKRATTHYRVGTLTYRGTLIC